ncbi:toxin efflux pump [Pseudozyma hubeiensis SY62]|uniref:Toxin efflux pump n=1 Tax=Pseudozyma hubeiensis (strain SY62) TaxID=1305764 RepID=R9NVR3_PSEHS|nr:toxin efflux pump [Pseudozyma hubeiensis SY62]GAC92603.1 toxin efflux pump [Pseudozyma hubeiensis SY62]
MGRQSQDRPIVIDAYQLRLTRSMWIVQAVPVEESEMLGRVVMPESWVSARSVMRAVRRRRGEMRPPQSVSSKRVGAKRRRSKSACKPGVNTVACRRAFEQSNAWLELQSLRSTSSRVRLPCCDALGQEAASVRR